MITLLILPFLLGDFVQKWYIPRGMIGECGRLLICDTDRDENYEFFMPPYGGAQKAYIYELHLPDTWQVDSFSYLCDPLMWDVGDFDLDGLADIVIDASATQGYPTMVISVAESPDSFSYPTQEVWRDTVGPPLVLPISACDIDQDGYPEIVKMGGDLDTAHYTDFLIYESTNNNTYAVTYTMATETSPTSTVAFGDFDQDEFKEFAMGTIDGEYSVFESPGDNTYEVRILNQQLPTVNITDCFAVPDADGDGKLEFVVKGFVVPTARINAFIFEATGDNTYEIIKSFDLFGGHNSYYGGYSDVGDVDGDSIPEIALEGCQNIYIIKAAGNDSFYVWETLPGNNSGSSVRVFDIDGNGLSEVIISGNNETRIYEYEVGVAESMLSEIPIMDLSASPNPFRDQSIIRYSIANSGYLVQHPALKIYDASGRLVKSFDSVSSIMDRASVISWQGDDDTGRKLPGGVYFLTITSWDHSTTEKLLLIR
jgi:hypothetical protein